ncbi:hypothetical protein CCR75_007696 [Bremia lactucae]|uniref:Amino acid transporter transmembrane domain-containing protein n=1 Tax=Bremia lactucae TaxID=4779 RepID=A0A976FKB4_BRELC|nr:hypothetical protein CCR75_007696 [Bremia lactucae]
MTLSDEILPLLSPTIERESPSQQHSNPRESFEVGFPLVVADDPTVQAIVLESKRGIFESFCQYIGRNCAVPFTLLMSAIGAGTLAVPYTFVLVTPLQAFFVLCGVGTAMAFTANTLVEIHVVVATASLYKDQSYRSTYQYLAKLAGGTLLAQGAGALTAFAVFGACVGCVCVVKDMAPLMLSAISNAFNQSSFKDQQHAVVIVVWLTMLLVLLPLGCLPKISALRFSSYFGVAFSVYLVGAVAYRALLGSIAINGHTDPSMSDTAIHAPLFWRISEVVGIYNFTFMLHLNVLPLLAQLVSTDLLRKHENIEENIVKCSGTEGRVRSLSRSRQNMQQYVTLSVGACIALYAVFGICAAHIYGYQTHGNILLNLSNDPIMVVPRVAILLTILLSFPLLFYPLRSLVLEMYVSCFMRSNTNEDSIEQKEGIPSRSIHAIVTILLLIAQVLGALQVPGLQVVFSFVGASILWILCYLFPLLFYVRLTSWRSSRKSIARMVLLSIVAVTASVFCIAATLQLVQD